MTAETKPPRTPDNFTPCECGESIHIYVKLIYRGRGEKDVFIAECQLCGNLVAIDIYGFLTSEEAMPLLINAWNESRELTLVTQERDALRKKLDESKALFESISLILAHALKTEEKS